MKTSHRIGFVAAKAFFLTTCLLLAFAPGAWAAESKAKAETKVEVEAEPETSTPGASATDAPTPEFYRLSVRDQIQLIVYGEPDLSFEQRIDSLGQVRVPLIGTIRIAGMTVRQAEDHIQQAYIDNLILRTPMVTVRVAGYAPKEVSVLGAVASPGKLAFPIEANSLDIVDVISQMGGFEGIAKSDHVRVTRTGPNGATTDFTVNVESMITGRGRGNATNRVEIFPGDVIWVPERLF